MSTTNERWEVVELNGRALGDTSILQDPDLCVDGILPTDREEIVAVCDSEDDAREFARECASQPNDFGLVDEDGGLMPSWIQIQHIKANGHAEQGETIER